MRYAVGIFFGYICICFVLCFIIALAAVFVARKLNTKLYRSTVNRRIFGVCGGIGEYFKVDPTLIRLIWVIVTLSSGSGILAYIVLALVLPVEHERIEHI